MVLLDVISWHFSLTLITSYKCTWTMTYKTNTNKSTVRWGNIRPFTILQGYPIYIAGQRRKLCGPYECALVMLPFVTSNGVKKDDLKKKNNVKG